MTKLQSKLNNIKKESFIITIEKGIDEVLFSYVKKYDAIMVFKCLLLLVSGLLQNE